MRRLISPALLTSCVVGVVYLVPHETSNLSQIQKPPFYVTLRGPFLCLTI